MHHCARQHHIIILKEDDPVAASVAALKMHNLANKFLTCRIMWMRLPRKDELDGAVAAHQRREPFAVAQQQVRALISSETSRKSDGQRVRIKHIPRFIDLG